MNRRHVKPPAVGPLHAWILGFVMLPWSAAIATERGTYEVAAKLHHAGAVFAEPTLRVRPGVPATLEVDGPDGYTLALTITRTSADALEVAAQLDSAHGTMAPTLVVRPGQPASVAIGDLGLDITVEDDHR